MTDQKRLTARQWRKTATIALIAELGTGTYNLRAGVTNKALTIDAGGNLYGASTEYAGYTCPDSGYGEIFELSPAKVHWKYTTIYKFSGGQDGALPNSGLIQDQNGNFYGVTSSGGANGYGVVFEVTP
jgi:uncharacterized repeat protein (TIGR03803 family)